MSTEQSDNPSLPVSPSTSSKGSPIRWGNSLAEEPVWVSLAWVLVPLALLGLIFFFYTRS